MIKILYHILSKTLGKAVVLFLVVVIGYLGCLIIKQEMYLSEINQQTIATQKQLDEAAEQNKNLKTEKENLQKPEYIERVARDELGMTKPGEVPYISSENQ